MMERYRNQRVEIIKIYYYGNSELVGSKLRAPRSFYGRNNRPSRSKMAKFESTGTVQRTARSVENIAAAVASVEESPNVSLTRRSQALDISVT